MIYPDNFEKKIGFNEIRTILRGRCLSSLGTEWVDNHLKFMTEYNNIREALRLAYEFSIFLENEDDIYEEHFYDVRQSLLRIRPERTYMEELELFDLKRSLKTIQDLVVFFQKQALNEDNETNVTNDDTFIESGNHIHAKYPSLFHLTESTPTFPEIINSINNILNKYGKIKDTASPELLSIRHSLEVTMRGISHSLRTIITEAQTEGYIDRDVSPTLRDGRLVIPVSPSLKRKIKGIIHDESATGKTVFIEPTAVVEANNRIREKLSKFFRIYRHKYAHIFPKYWNPFISWPTLTFCGHWQVFPRLLNPLFPTCNLFLVLIGYRLYTRCCNSP